jgi:hemolysin III
MQRFREPVNGFTHLAGAIIAAGGLFWLIVVTQNNTPKLLSVVIYGVSTILLYAASATFHLVKTSPNRQLWLRRLDHAAIYLMIAGTYTPFLYNVLDGSMRWLMLALVWLVALTGAGYKLLLLRDAGIFSLVCYVAVGCVGILVAPYAFQVLSPAAIILIIIGCAFYMVGVIVFGLEKPNLHRHFGHHEIWHLLVLGGSIVHFAAILLYIV